MHVLVGIALKSLLIAGLTLALLSMMKRRSAAERSWVAHIGLLALVIMALAPLVLPAWNVEAPALFGWAETTEAAAPVTPRTFPAAASVPLQISSAPSGPIESRPPLSPEAAVTAVYALPAAVLLLITFLALARLFALRARADVLVDGHWLSSLARAQRRMGFKHGTALLTSNELSSPISWGLLRPVILLNNRAVEASGEAEAILAHELAHVARMDWIKLLLARVTTALFWFNPLVWLLAREAHQLREETADDAVLAADVIDTDYAQLLVGVARHECPGLLLGAHGVAPSKSSLSRRVARVLDARSVRGPGARSFTLGVFVGAVLIAAPLAALTLTPAGASGPTPATPGVPSRAAANATHTFVVSDTPADLPHIIASGVTTSVATVRSAVDGDEAQAERDAAADAARDAIADAKEARREALAEASRAKAEAHAEVRKVKLDPDQIHDLIEMKVAGVSPGYINELRSAQHRLKLVTPGDFAALRNAGVTPEFARDLASAGLANLDIDGLVMAKATGLTGDYARAVVAAGVPPRIADYVQLRAAGVPSQYVVKIKKSGVVIRDADKVVELWAAGVQPEELRGITVRVRTPRPPRTPQPPEIPAPEPDDG